MGAAAYNRGSAALARQVDAALAGARNTLAAKAVIWRDALTAGAVLTFRCADGRTLTAGPNRVAVPGSAPEFAVYRYGGKFAGEWFGSAWGMALRITEQVGRVKPYRVA